jgi:hypothetical protein
MLSILKDTENTDFQVPADIDADVTKAALPARPMEQCAGTVKKLSLELGGNVPFTVFDDADIEMAVKSLPVRRQGRDRLEISERRYT